MKSKYLDPYKLREDFPVYNNASKNLGDPDAKLVYLDNAATTFKPRCVLSKMNEYYENYSTNAHRGDYSFSYITDVMYEKAREQVAHFINAEPKEVVFTSGTSMSLNMVAYGISKFLNEGDEIILTEAEHASNVLPFFAISKQTKAVIKYIPLTKDGKVTEENFINTLTSKTKVVSLAQVTNVLGYTVDVKKLAAIAHSYNKDIIFVVDGAQAAPHMKIDVKDLDCDFYCFSGHKMVGPTGIGCMYGKYELLNKIDPFLVGGGVTARFDMCGNVKYLYPPTKFEAGTQNIAGAIGFGEACRYLEEIGMDNISKYEKELRDYAISKLEKLDNIILYNKDADHGIITFNIKNVVSQDIGTYLNSKNVCVRTGQHCAKILLDFLQTDSTCRASLYFYNTKEDIDTFVEACKNGGNFLDAYFVF